MLKLSLFLLTVISIAFAYRNENFDLSESKELLTNELLDEMKEIENYHHLSNREDDYLKIYGSLATENDVNADFGEIFRPKQKRFLKGIFDKIFGSSEKTTESPSTFKTKSTTRYTTSRLFSPIKQITTEENDDVFYKLKVHCARTYDNLCRTKKQELHDLVKKCDILTSGYSKSTKACDDVLSIYCYVFYEFSTCYDRKYKPYQPHQKTMSPISPTRSSSTRAPIQIPIKFITSSSYTTTRTSKPWIITTKEKSTTYRPTNRPSSNNLDSPFDGPVNSVPKDAKKLKEIGEYCLSHKDINCDKMLTLLKNEFKKCERQPKTDRNCQSFKMEFCTAFKNFPCCPDVLAGRQCNGRSNSLKRSYFNLYIQLRK